MTDGFGREINYLRISVTDLCNLRCVYCMPDCGVEKMHHSEIMSVEEIEMAARAAVECRVKKIRVTGGEPLVRRGIDEICEKLAAIPGVEELCMTTNGVLLPNYAKKLYKAGVTRLNISLDTMDPEKFASITRMGRLEDVMEGLRAAEAAGFDKIKINVVLMGGINDDEIPAFVELTRNKDMQVRFIELMPIGQCAEWDKSRFLSGQAVLRAVPELEEAGTVGVARLYRLPGGKGAVGLINPLSQHFCPDCNRIRITADGKLKPCLHSAQEIDLRGLDQAQMRQTIRAAIGEKPRRHELAPDAPSHSLRNMNEIGG